MGEPSEAFRFQGDDDLRFLRDELYEGSWDLMLRDLEARLNAKPSVFKITENIKEDIVAIKRLKAEDEAAESQLHDAGSDRDTKKKDKRA